MEILFESILYNSVTDLPNYRRDSRSQTLKVSQEHDAKIGI